MAEQDRFPKFNDGDVLIVLSGSRVYQLHSSILKAISPKMKLLLHADHTATLNSKAVKSGVTIRNRLAGAKNPDNWSDVAVILEPETLNAEGRPVAPRPAALDLENGRIVEPVYPAYHAVLGAIYSCPINLRTFDEAGLSDMLEVAVNIVYVAEYLEVVQVVSAQIEAALLGTGQKLHRAIAQSPAPWLNFAHRIKSRTLFREALIHATGKFNNPEMTMAMPGMHQDVSSILKKKAEMLKEGISQAVFKMLSYYPQHMQRSLTVGLVDKDHIGRASYSNDIFSWIALTAFRHYVGQNIATDKTHHSEDMGFSFISKAGKGGDTYLDKPTMAEFHRIFPMSTRGSTVTEQHIIEIKEYVKRFVVHLLKNNSQLDTHTYGQEYFKCIEVVNEDYPWEADNKAQAPDYEFPELEDSEPEEPEERTMWRE